MDNRAPRSALLVGATGAVGGYCLEYLLGSELYNKVIVLTRSPLAVDHPKLEKHQIDFDRLDEFQAFMAADDVFCCLGLTAQKASSRAEYYKVDVTYPYQIARFASGRGAKRYFLVTSMGANPKSRFFYWRIKGEVEDLVSSERFDSVRLFRPGLIVGPRKEFRLIETFAILFFKIFPFLFAGPAARYKPLDARDIARAIVRSGLDESMGVHVYESSAIRSIAR